MIKKYEVFKQSIKKYIQNSGLDIGVVYYILKDIYKEVENLYYVQLNKEALEQAKQNNELDQDEEPSE